MKAAFYYRAGDLTPNKTVNGTKYSLCFSFEDNEKVPFTKSGAGLVEVIENLPVSEALLKSGVRGADTRGLIIVNPMNQEHDE